MKFGNINLRHGIALAPMAGFTDRAMRRVCRDFGCEYSTTEMVSAKAVVYNDKKTFALARILADEGPVAIQIFGSEPAIMAEAAARLESPREGIPPVAIDINMGCPVHKIFSNGEGSALMRSPELIYDITRAVSRAVSIPTTVKLRLGVDAAHINAVECALAAEEAGAATLCLHGRTREQMYGGSADRKMIKNVKESVHIPLFANGDIATAEDALSMLDDTGADGIAVGRGAVGNPFLFAEILAAAEGRDIPVFSIGERIETALLQLRLAAEDKGEKIAVPESRKQIALYLRHFRGAAHLRAEINRAATCSEVEAVLRSISELEN